MTNTAVQLEEEWEALLPEWAIRKATPKVYEVGASLPTRDGRRMGNAHIVAIKESKFDTSRPYYEILTDAGNVCVMNSSEINELFWPPRWISSVREVVRKFGWMTPEYQHWVPPEN